MKSIYTRWFKENIIYNKRIYCLNSNFSGPLASVLTINCDAPTEEIPAGVYIAEEFEGLPPAMMDDAIGG